MALIHPREKIGTRMRAELVEACPSTGLGRINRLQVPIASLVVVDGLPHLTYGLLDLGLQLFLRR